MKELKIKQKYFSLHNKFKIYDEDENVAFQAQNKFFKLWNNMVLYDAAGLEPLVTLRAKFALFFSKFRVLSGDYEQMHEIGSIRERFNPWWGIKTARVEVEGMPKIWFKCGPIHLKAYVCDDNWKKDKSVKVIRIAKKLLKICDTYTVKYDDTKVPATLAALVGLWYDMLNHGDKH